MFSFDVSMITFFQIEIILRFSWGYVFEKKFYLANVLIRSNFNMNTLIEKFFLFKIREMKSLMTKQFFNLVQLMSLYFQILTNNKYIQKN